MGILPCTLHKHLYIFYLSTWLVASRLQGSPLEERLPGSSWQPRLLASLLLQLGVSRSPTATGLAQLLSGRSGGTRSQQSCWSASCRSRGWFVRLLRTSRPTCVSKVL